MSTYNLTGLENAAIQYGQVGMDALSQGDAFIPSSGLGQEDHKIYYIYKGPGIGVADNQNYLGLGTENDKSYWCAIQNLSGSEGVPVQATTLDGEHLAKTGAINVAVDNYINIAAGDTIYGRFTEIYILKANTGGEYKLRAIRGKIHGT